MKQHSSLQVGAVNERGETQKRKPKWYSKKKPVMDDDSNKPPLPIGRGPVLAELLKDNHEHGLLDAPQRGQDSEDTEKVTTEKYAVDTLKQGPGNPSRRKMLRMERHARLELSKLQQEAPGEAVDQPTKASQAPSTLEASNLSNPGLEKPVHTTAIVEPQTNVGKTSTSIVAVDSTGKPTRRGPYKSRRQQRENGRGYNRSRGKGNSKADNGLSESKHAQFDVAANRSTTIAVVAKDEEKGKHKALLNSFRSGQSAEKHQHPDARQEGSESIYQQHLSQISLSSADGSLRSPTVVAVVTYTKISSEPHHLTPTYLNIKPDDCTECKKDSDIAPILSAQATVNQSPLAGLGEPVSSVELLCHTSLIPKQKITGNHRPSSEPSHSLTYLDTANFDNVSTVSCKPKHLIFPGRKCIRSLSHGSYHRLQPLDVANNALMADINYKPVRGSFADSLRSGKYGRPITTSSASNSQVCPTLTQEQKNTMHESQASVQASGAKEQTSDAPPHENRTLTEVHKTPAQKSITTAQKSVTTAQKSVTTAQKSVAPAHYNDASAEGSRALERNDCAPNAAANIKLIAQKSTLSANRTYHNVHDPEPLKFRSTDPSAVSEPPISMTQLKSVEALNAKFVDDLDTKKTTANAGGIDHVISVSGKRTSSPLAQITSSRNQPIRTEQRAERAKFTPYLPPHMRALQSNKPSDRPSDKPVVSKEEIPKSNLITARSNASSAGSNAGGLMKKDETQVPKDKGNKYEHALPKSDNRKPSHVNKVGPKNAATSQQHGHSEKSDLQLHWDESSKVASGTPKLGVEEAPHNQVKATVSPGNIDDSKKKTDTSTKKIEYVAFLHAAKQSTGKPDIIMEVTGAIDYSRAEIDTSTKKYDCPKTRRVIKPWTGAPEPTEKVAQATKDSNEKADASTKKVDYIKPDRVIKHSTGELDLIEKVTPPTEAKVEPGASTSSKKHEVSNVNFRAPEPQEEHTQAAPQTSTCPEALNASTFDAAYPTNPYKPVQKDPEEIFVPLCKSRVSKDPVYSSIEAQLPEHLRNLPRPVLMGPVVKRNAELAALKPQIGQEELMQRVIQRNEASYKPVVELKPGTQLALELASNESTRPAFLAADQANLDDVEDLAVPIVLSPAQKAAQETRWRYFNKIEESDPGKIGNIPKETLVHELVDWDGNWRPATLEWDTRQQFNHNNKRHIRYLDNWVTQRVTDALNAPYMVDVTDAEWKSGVLPASGTRKQYQVYPPDCIMRRVPLEYGPVDWSLTPTERPNDPYSLVPERRNQCSRTSARKFHKEYIAKARARDQEKYERRLEIQEFNRQKERSRAEVAPKANIYIRPAQASDVPQLAQVYNHYVRTSVQTPEHESTELADWQDRVKAAKDESLAFMVAVLRSNKANGRGDGNNKRGRGHQRGGAWSQRRREPASDTFGEMIVGFAYAEDHAGRNTIFQYVAELQVFVDPNHTRQGIGRTLMDRMMESLDRAYHSYGGTDFITPIGGQNYTVGGSRDIHKIMISVGFHYGQEKEFEWRKRWLEMVWDFDHMVTFPCFGNKFGKGVNIAQFVKETNQQNGCSTWYREQPDRIPHWERAMRVKEKENKVAKEREVQAALAREEAMALQEELRAEEEEYEREQW